MALSNLAKRIISVVGQGAGSPTGSDGVYDDASDLLVIVNVTAVGGTPSLAITVQWSPDGTFWADADTTADIMAAITAPGAKVKRFPRKGAFHKVTATVSGTTPSMTFDVWTRVLG